jgi:hypothetical protein
MSINATFGRLRSPFVWVGLVALTVVIACLLFFRWHETPSVKAYTLLQLAPEAPRLLPDRQEKHALDPVAMDIFARTQVALAKSRLVLDATLRKPEVAALQIVQAQKDPVAWLEETIQVDFKVPPTILRIGLSTNTNKPEELLVIVDALRDAYLAEVVEKENASRQKDLGRLEMMYYKHEERLRTMKEKVRNLEGAIGMSRKQLEKALVQELFDCRQELRRARLAKLAPTEHTEKEKAALEAREKFLLEEMRDLEKTLSGPNSISVSSIPMQMLGLEIETQEQVARRLLMEIGTLKVEMAAPNRVLAVQPAVIDKGR